MCAERKGDLGEQTTTSGTLEMIGSLKVSVYLGSQNKARGSKVFLRLFYRGLANLSADN